MFLRKVVAFFRNICFFSQLKSPFIDVESPFSVVEPTFIDVESPFNVVEPPFSVYERRLYLPRLHLSYYSFCQSIYSVRIILLVEAGTEEGGESLIETGTDRTEEGLDEMI
jgi:hypothetical protein